MTDSATPTDEPGDEPGAGRTPTRAADPWTRRAFEVAQVGLASVDEAGVHITANPTYLNLLGLTRRAVVGQPLAAIADEAGRPQVARWIGDPHQSIPFTAGSGDDHGLTGWITPLPYGDGRARAVVQLVPADLNPAAGEGLARFAAIADHISDALVIVDAAGEIVLTNAAADERFGLERQDALAPGHVSDLLDERSRSALRVTQRTARGPTITVPVTVVGEGDVCPLTITEVRSHSDRLLGLAYLFGPPTRTDAERAPRPAELAGRDDLSRVGEALAVALTNTRDLVWVLDDEGPVAATAGAREQLGLAADAPIGHLTLGQLVDTETARAIVAWLGERHDAADFTGHGRLNGPTRSPLCDVSITTQDSASGRLWVLRAEPSPAAAPTGPILDELTDLPTQVVLLDRLDNAIQRSRRTAQPTGLVVFDIDRFGPIADAIGPDASDRLICAVADRLRTNVRPGDTLTRSGDDEFAAVQEQLMDIRDAQRFAERIRACVDDPLEIDGVEWFVTLSAGVAITQPGVTTVDGLVRNARAALTKAKGSGRGRTVVFGEALREVQRRHSTVRRGNHQLRTPAR